MRLSKQTKNILIVACIALTVTVLLYFHFTSVKESFPPNKDQLIANIKQKMSKSSIRGLKKINITELEFINDVSQQIKDNDELNLEYKSSTVDKIWGSLKWILGNKIIYISKNFTIQPINSDTFNNNRTLTSIACGVILGQNTKTMKMEDKIKEINSFISFMTEAFSITLNSSSEISVNLISAHNSEVSDSAIDAANAAGASNSSANVKVVAAGISASEAL